MPTKRNTLLVASLLALVGVLFVGAVALVAAKGGVYEIDVVDFRGEAVEPVADTPAPTVRIDTNVTRSGAPIVWGRAESRAPYGLVLSHTDESMQCRELELTAVRLTYADGTAEPAAMALALPRREPLRTHETTNSTSEGLVRSRYRFVQLTLPGLVTKDQDVEAVVEGRFLLADGGEVAFRCVVRFAWERRSESVRMVEVWESI